MNIATESFGLSATLREILADFGFRPESNAADSAHILGDDQKAIVVRPVSTGICIESLSLGLGGLLVTEILSAPLAWSEQPFIFRSFLFYLGGKDPEVMSFTHERLVANLQPAGFRMNPKPQHHVSVIAEGPDGLIVKDSLHDANGITTRGVGLYWEDTEGNLVAILKPSPFWFNNPGSLVTVIKNLFPIYLRLQKQQTA